MNPLIAVEEPCIEKLLKIIKHSRVLDAGTDTGRNLLQVWRSGFKIEGTTYQLPKTRYSREDCLKAVCNAGFTIIEVKDIPTAEIPKGYVSEETINAHGDIGLCLMILGQK